MKKNFVVYLCTLLIFFAFDFVWLAKISPSFYKEHIGHLLADSPNLPAAISFYLIFISGLVYFSILPQLQETRAVRIFGRGVFFGLVTYSTFDLTSQAVFQGWPTIVTVIDLIWGSLLSGATTLATVSLIKRSRL